MHLNMTKHVFRHLNDKVLVTDFKRADRTANLGTVKHPCDNPIPIRSNFDSAETVLTLIHLDALLPKVQSPAIVVNIKQNKDLPYHDAYGFNTHAPNGTSPDVALATPMTTRFLEDMGALHTEAIKRVFQPTKGINDVGIAYEDEEYNLQPLPDALHSRRVGYMPLVDSGNCFLGQPKEASTPGALSMTGREWTRKDADTPAVCLGNLPTTTKINKRPMTKCGTLNWEQTHHTSVNVGVELGGTCNVSM